MNRQDFDKWKEDMEFPLTDEFSMPNDIPLKVITSGRVTELYNLLSKEIGEKDEEIERLKNSQDVKVSFDAAKETVSKAYYWKQRCEAAENVVQSLLAGTDSDSEIENWNNWTKLKDNQL